MGPGRYREMPAMMSSRVVGFSSFMKLFMPALSSWNMPSVLPLPMSAMTSGSLKSMPSMSIGFPLRFSASAAAF